MSAEGQSNAEPDEKEKLAWLRLSRTENIGPITFFKLIKAFGSAQEALDHLPDISKRGGKTLKAADPQSCEKEYSRLIKSGGQMIIASEDSYPALLKEIADPPPVISVLGNPDLMHQSCIAIVGARNASLNGKKFISKLASELGAHNQIIASGLARGVDTAAHEGALETGTIAVVAGGLDIVYPEENKKLYDEIREQGCIIAESALGQKPFAQSFPKRNRIVSGLSRAIIVGEANMRSGSLITARLAGEHGRELMAIPGAPMDPRAAGPNHLIREGATLIRSAEDALEALINFNGQDRNPPTQNAMLDSANDDFDFTQNTTQEDQNLILELLSHTPIALDEIIRSCHLSVSSVQSIVLELELAGRVKRHPSGQISLIEE